MDVEEGDAAGHDAEEVLEGEGHRNLRLAEATNRTVRRRLDGAAGAASPPVGSAVLEAWSRSTKRLPVGCRQYYQTAPVGDPV